MQKKNLSWIDLITVNLFWLGLNLRNNAVGTIFMPYLVDHFVGEGLRNSALGGMRTAGLVIAMLVQPAMPASAAKLLDLLAQPEAKRTFAHLGKTGRLEPGTLLPAPVGVFPRYVRPAEEGEAPAKPPKQKKGKGDAT